MATPIEERYDDGFDGRATIDTVAEIMMEAENSISLSQILDSSNNNQINNHNREDFKHNKTRFHTKKVSPVLNVYSMDKISTIESLKMVWKIVFYQLLIGVLVSLMIILFLWILVKYIFKLNQCDSYNKSIKSLSFKIFAIQSINSIFYCLYIASILWIILDEFKSIISLIKRLLIILVSMLLLWILFLFYGLSASKNILVWNGLCLFVIICLIFIILTRVCGYYAIYMIFPVLISLFINYIIFHVIILTLFKLIINNNNSYKIIFAFIYPIILHLLQISTLKAIQYIQLPYTFNLFAHKCCACLRMKNNETDNNEDENNENNIRLEETVSPQYIFFICSLIAIIISTLQQIGYFVLIFDNNFSDIPILCILYIFFEVMARNKIWYEMYLKIRYKTKRESNMDVLSQIYYGAKYSMQYIPIFIIILLNIFVDDCYQLNIQSNRFPIIFIMVSVVFCCDLFTFLVKKCAIKCELWGVPNQNNQDITRQYKFIKLHYQSLLIILVSCITLSIHVLYISSVFVF